MEYDMFCLFCDMSKILGCARNIEKYVTLILLSLIIFFLNFNSMLASIYLEFPRKGCEDV